MSARRVYNPKDKPPAPALIKHKGRVAPLTAFDQELLDEYPEGQEFDLVPRTNGNNRQMKLYWMILRRAVEATEGWPAAEYLHHELKIKTGHWRAGLDTQTGKMRKMPDSIAFDRMTAPQFKNYFNHAMRELSEILGCDPFELIKRDRS